MAPLPPRKQMWPTCYAAHTTESHDTDHIHLVFCHIVGECSSVTIPALGFLSLRHIP